MTTETNIPTPATPVSIWEIQKRDFNLRGAQFDSKSDIVKMQFQELKASIKARHFDKGTGLLASITVSPVWKRGGDEEVTGTYFLIDGCQRLTCYQQLNEEYPNEGFDKIPCTIDRSIKSDRDAIIAQLTLNEQRIPTSKNDQAKALLMMAEDDDGTQLPANELAKLFNKSVVWVYNTLKMTHLTDTIKNAVFEDQIPVTHALILSKLPLDNQDEMFQEFLETPEDERASWSARVSDYIETLKKDRKAKKPEGPTPHLRTKKVIEDRYKNPEPEDVDKNWKQCMDWLFQMDPDSLLAAKTKEESKKLEAELKKQQKLKEQLEENQRKIEERQKELEAKERELAAQEVK